MDTSVAIETTEAQLQGDDIVEINTSSVTMQISTIINGTTVSEIQNAILAPTHEMKKEGKKIYETNRQMHALTDMMDNECIREFIHSNLKDPSCLDTLHLIDFLSTQVEAHYKGDLDKHTRTYLIQKLLRSPIRHDLVMLYRQTNDNKFITGSTTSLAITNRPKKKKTGFVEKVDE